MADTSNLSNYLKDIADAIREKKGTEEQIPAADFDTEIKSIETGSDTSDATATADDILNPKTAYVKGQKITGSIIPNYVDASKNITYNQFDSSIAMCDYRLDLGYYICINETNNTLNIYSIDTNELIKTYNTESEISTVSSTLNLKLKNAKFSKNAVVDNTYNIITNMFNIVNNRTYYVGLAVIRFNLNEPQATGISFNTYEVDGKDYGTSNRSHGTGLIENNNYVVSTIETSSSYWLSSPGDARFYYIDNDTNTITRKFKFDLGQITGTIPFLTDDNKFLVVQSPSHYYIGKIDDSYNSISVISSKDISTANPRCITTNNGVIFNNNYYTSNGVVHTYTNLPFSYNDNVIYFKGYLIQFNNTSTVNIYELNNDTFEITFVKSILVDGIPNDAFYGESEAVNSFDYPLFNTNDLLFTTTTSKNYVLYIDALAKVLSSLEIKDKIYYDTSSSGTTSDKVLFGNTYYNFNGNQHRNYA